MLVLAQQQHVPDMLSNFMSVGIVVAVLVLIFFLVLVAVFAHYFRFWIQSKTTRAGIGIWDLIGMQMKVKARVTVRANLRQLIGGATEETIIARVGEGIVSAIGSAESHHIVLENPDRISKTVLARRLDSHTAFEIVSIDIAEV